MYTPLMKSESNSAAGLHCAEFRISSFTCLYSCRHTHSHSSASSTIDFSWYSTMSRSIRETHHSMFLRNALSRSAWTRLYSSRTCQTPRPLPDLSSPPLLLVKSCCCNTLCQCCRHSTSAMYDVLSVLPRCGLLLGTECTRHPCAFLLQCYIFCHAWTVCGCFDSKTNVSWVRWPQDSTKAQNRYTRSVWSTLGLVIIGFP